MFTYHVISYLIHAEFSRIHPRLCTLWFWHPMSWLVRALHGLVEKKVVKWERERRRFTQRTGLFFFVSNSLFEIARCPLSKATAKQTVNQDGWGDCCSWCCCSILSQGRHFKLHPSWPLLALRGLSSFLNGSSASITKRMSSLWQSCCYLVSLYYPSFLPGLKHK